ncbi:uncharacterized protein Eint_091680 [Encephalitozoon intestinalis ATCC 50506]|uniref:DUF2428 domain-containing protein n=1 Tax=Encephalitozoon intestinalis (strain ATCC 50506) TaxID=876142 RepID=E0S940_ENCIT|nr:uncharacterized protein Eint_091680 [Encephalitozoon intestinalis ATCC 50506]ADM12296.1 hypothetical protein Eint_091680 [Encephalitozoon intestinalis ATCC 50506]UTX46107.1 putative importin [Encephalitozoon intestinalis]
MDSNWNTKDLYLLALEVSHLHKIGYGEIMSMRLRNGIQISCTLDNGEEIGFGHLWRYEGEEAETRFKLCLVETQLKNSTEGAVDHLLMILPNTSKANQLTIFMIFYKLTTKYKVYDKRILRECKAHLHAIHLRYPILKTLVAYTLFKEDLVSEEFTDEEIIEMNLVDPRNLNPENPDAVRLVKRLFSTITKTSFRYSRRIFKHMDEKFFFHFPLELNGVGYSHLRELIGELSPRKALSIGEIICSRSAVRLFFPLKIDDVERFFIHKDVEVRIESVRHIDTVGLMKRFLEVNQFIYNRNMVKLLSRYFRIWLGKRVNEEHEFKVMYTEIVSPMLRSRNTYRRLLGVHLMDSLIDIGVVEPSGHSWLLFDPDYEIRSIVCKYSGWIPLNIEEARIRIESYQSYDVNGCVEYIKSCRPEWLISDLKDILDTYAKDFMSGKKGIEEVPIYGFLRLFSEVKSYNIKIYVDRVYEYCFGKLSNVIHEQDDDGLVVYWKNMKECCNYYCSLALEGDKSSAAKLVRTLLYINHLGVVLQVSQYLNKVLRSVVFPQDELLEIVDLSFKRIQNCKIFFRKSGGIPLLLVQILRNYPSIINYVLERLLEMIDKDENNIKVHCLNILSRIIGDGSLSPKIPLQTIELFKISFRCSRSSLWAVRNIGIEIFSHLVRKVFERGPEFIVSIAHKEFRNLLYEELSSCSHNKDDILVFLILHLYGRVKKLDEREMELVRRFSSRSDLIGLESKSICEGKECRRPQYRETRIKFDDKMNEGEILLRLLILLDSEQPEERRMAESYMKDVYKLSLYSEEYFRHYIAKRICRIGYKDVAVKKLQEYGLGVEKSQSCFFKDSPSNERFDLEYNISLIEKYKSQKW